MPNHLLLSISKQSLKNWDVCKEKLLWGASKLTPTVQAIKPGDKFIVWIGGAGVKALGTVEEAPRSVPADEPSPWPDGRPYPVRFKIKIDQEFRKGRSYKFPGNRCAELNMITLDLQRGISLLEKWQYDKMVSDATTHNFEQEQGQDGVEKARRTKRVVVPTTFGTRTHDEIQLLLTKLGRAVGCDVWVARNDRNKTVGGQKLSDLTLSALPRLGFDANTLQIVELIDVLWLNGSAIKAAFEVEHTTGVYSGLLRMSDLLTEQPNTAFDLFIVASELRRAKVVKEINRPTFSRLTPPLSQICRFIPYEKLPDVVDRAVGLAGYVQYRVLDRVAETCNPYRATP
ncbi:MAG TPA: hypothetical protein VD902_18925 [Symbiobacteriaceae bacterium]|nr:hypothetical protein [Symbiobacteriaceae bacterium]